MSGTRLKRTTRAAAGMAVALTALAAGSPALAATATTPPSRAVTRVVVHNGELVKGSRARLIPDGDKVRNTVTLDNCGFVFTTEAHRVARRQVTLFTAKGQSLGGNEVVAYDSPAQAARALAEFRTSVARCPRGRFVPSPVAGAPVLRYDALTIGKDAKLPVKDTVVSTMTVTFQDSGRRVYAITILQRKGNVLDAVYVSSVGKPITPAAAKQGRRLAVLTGKRLAALR